MLGHEYMQHKNSATYALQSTMILKMAFVPNVD